MSANIKKSKRGGKTLYIRCGLRYTPETHHIHLSIPESDGFLTTISNRPDRANSDGCHPNLFGKLDALLTEESKRDGETLYVNCGVWYTLGTGYIHFSVPKSKRCITTINDVSGSVRHHQILFEKLAALLKEAGVLGPETD